MRRKKLNRELAVRYKDTKVSGFRRGVFGPTEANLTREDERYESCLRAHRAWL